MSWINMKINQKWEWVPEELRESTGELRNPARGWYEIYTFRAEDGIHPQELRWSLREGETLALVLIDLRAYRDRALENKALENIRSILSFFMQYQKDVILRPVYDTEGKGREREPEEFETVLLHVRQIGAVLQQMDHSVCIFQGLLIGSWGEMHDSRYLTPEHLRKLYDTLRPYLGGEIYLAVRTPAMWRILTDEERFHRGDPGKTAVFDDGILGSMTHLGTFGMMTREAAGWEQAWTRKEELEFLERVTGDAPCGGEVVSGADGSLASAEFVLSELKMMHLTYLNCAHDRKVLDGWEQICLKVDGAWKERSLYDYVGSHLGYRLVVRSAAMKRCLSGKWELELEIENTGFAAPFQELELFLVWEAEGGTLEAPVEFDVRQCVPGEREKIVQRFGAGCDNRMKGKYTAKTGSQIAGMILQTGAWKGQIFLELRRKKDGQPVQFANEKSADRLLIGSLRGRKWVSKVSIHTKVNSL